MEVIELLTMALRLKEPWHITKVEFVKPEGSSEKLHLWVDFTKGYKFNFGDGQTYPAYDTSDEVWRHWNFYQHTCFLHARVPCIRINDHEVKYVDVPWTRKGINFIML